MFCSEITRPNDFVVSANHASEVTHSNSSFHLDLGKNMAAMVIFCFWLFEA
jgi:hypothetical protein